VKPGVKEWFDVVSYIYWYHIRCIQPSTFNLRSTSIQLPSWQALDMASKFSCPPTVPLCLLHWAVVAQASLLPKEPA
jgi:hypothetical protein